MSMLTVRLNKLVEGWKRLLKLITKLVGKWQSYIIGGGAILLFFVLLLLRLDIPQRLFRGEEKQTPVMIIAANGETWLTITQNGQKRFLFLDSQASTLNYPLAGIQQVELVFQLAYNHDLQLY